MQLQPTRVLGLDLRIVNFKQPCRADRLPASLSRSKAIPSAIDSSTWDDMQMPSMSISESCRSLLGDSSLLRPVSVVTPRSTICPGSCNVEQQELCNLAIVANAVLL